MPTEFEKDVFAWGNDKPWKGRKPLKHGTVFAPGDVLTDGGGNIVDMPTLQDKPCFGRPEVYVRQFNRKRTIIVYDKEKEIAASRCGSCKIGDACKKVATERVNSDPAIRQAFLEWSDHCRLVHGGKRVCTGPVEGRMWERFKRAIAQHGPWTSSNDARLAELEEEKAEARRRKWRADEARRREREREQSKKDRAPPSREFIGHALLERNRRASILEERAGDPTLPPSISKILPQYAAATAAITADVWLADVILRAMGDEAPGPGVIARKLVQLHRNGGRSYDTLKARVSGDLRRIRDLEKGRDPVWAKFDPDGDLAKKTPSEIDQILADLDAI